LIWLRRLDHQDQRMNAGRRVFEPVNLSDVRMIERGEELRFALETGAAPEKTSGSTFSATSRFSLVSRAR
jgi:hypothetical protein